MATTRQRREQVTVRLAPTALARVTELAKDRDMDRAQLLRDLLRIGLTAYEAGAR